MISIEALFQFYPPYIRNQRLLLKYMLKEHILLMILDYLSNTAYARKMSFIGGTSIRLIRGIDRFSEDLDFDVKQLHWLFRQPALFISPSPI